MKKLLFALFTTFTLISTSLHAQEDVEHFKYWQYYSDVENSLYKHFCSIAFDQINARKKQIARLSTKADWEQRQVVVKGKLAKIIGEYPQKTTLNAQVTEVLKKDGYRIEKIIYESKPGYYVTSAMYIPNKVGKNAPAIFYACGHSKEGFRVGVYQHIIINLVKKGFVVFTIDPMGQGERFEYWDEQKQELMYPIPDHEHSYAGAQCLISGYSVANNFIWDAIRGIDYMLTRNEIDPARIGMTGRSGGGNITAYLGALDDRILATAPECYITSYEYLYKSIGPQCAEQNLYKMLEVGLDHADFLVARAPKPTMVISTTRDFFSIQGTRDSYQEARKMYKALGASEKLLMVEDDSIHQSTLKNREAMYAFFQKYLKNPGSSQDIMVDIPTPKELKITETGQILTTYKGETLFSLNKAIVSNQISSLKESRENIEYHRRNISEHGANKSKFEYPDDFGLSIFSGRLNRSTYTLDKYFIKGSGEYMLPLVLFQPIKLAKKNLVILLDTKGMNHAVNQDSLVLSLVKEGRAVLLVDLPGIGSLGGGYLKGDSYIGSTSYNQWFAAILTGKSTVGLRAEDIVRVVDFAHKKLTEYSSRTLVAIGGLGSDLLHAATFESKIDNIVLYNTFLSYAEFGITHRYDPKLIPHTIAGAIEDYDLPDLMANFCPGNLLIINPISPSGALANTNEIKNNIQFPKDVYIEEGVGEKFQLVEKIEEMKVIEHLVSWLDLINI
ncbi:alpha/beta hydrolase family protein [Reichenbachiella sp. MALMAid0571]|uniref:alpha/beta hydrolase family protein n=1 Tax=Reichenbachiella sp. MALMAid0571 TaxID=3143939 RepID=UPI0032E01855